MPMGETEWVCLPETAHHNECRLLGDFISKSNCFEFFSALGTKNSPFLAAPQTCPP
jgi:hypothetical protein